MSRLAFGLPAIAAAVVALTFGATPASASFGFLPGEAGFSATVLGEGGATDAEAGSHPVSLELAVGLNQAGGLSDGDLRDLSFELPPGLLENPTAVPVCSQGAFHTPRANPLEEEGGGLSRSGESCPDRTQIGVLTLTSSYGGGETRTFGLFNLQPPPGAPSEIGANPYGDPIVFVPKIRQAAGEYGITLEAHGVSQLLSIGRLGLSLWGDPWSILHNEQRGNCLNEAEPGFGWAKCSIGRPARNPAVAYLTLPTSCEGPLTFTAAASAWEQPAPPSRSVSAPALEDCGGVPFEPEARAQLSDPRASSPSGYEFDIRHDTAGVRDPQRRAPSPARRAVVELPEGVTINPSVGSGLGVCTPAQYEAETASSLPGAGCPNESKIGDFSVQSPIIAGTLEGGSIYLASPFQNPFQSLIAIYLVAKSNQRGFLVKVAGQLAADPQTGRLTATFDRLPQLPYSELRIHFREGQRSPLATPPACGAISTEVDLTPWRDAALVRHSSLPATIVSGVGGGPCPSGLAPFAPKALGGTLNSRAGAYSPFYLHLTRTDPEQEITSYSATLPPGLLGKIAGIPYCPEAAIAAAALRSGTAERDRPSCPAASLIGHTTAGYGVGTVLTYAPGNLYLAGPYRGSQFSVVAIDSALVGPFDLGVVEVRSAVRIDPTTAQASIDATGTDPIPHIIDGIPIHLRDVRAYIDRPGFTLNPTSCAPSSMASALNGSGARFGDGADDTLATATAPFQAFDCGSLGFSPEFSMALKGGTHRGRHPALRVTVLPRQNDANIASAQVTLPPSLFLDQANIDTVCTGRQFTAGACPAGSIYGHVRAFTPLLEAPLEGPAYLRSSQNTLPDLVFALQGHGIEVDVDGRIDSAKGGIRGTFASIPDAPVTKFVLHLRGGKRGVLVNSANLCQGTQRATARLVGHNNLGLLTHPALKVSCPHRRHRGKKSHHPQRGQG